MSGLSANPGRAANDVQGSAYLADLLTQAVRDAVAADTEHDDLLLTLLAPHLDHMLHSTLPQHDDDVRGRAMQLLRVYALIPTVPLAAIMTWLQRILDRADAPPPTATIVAMLCAIVDSVVWRINRLPTPAERLPWHDALRRIIGWLPADDPVAQARVARSMAHLLDLAPPEWAHLLDTAIQHLKKEEAGPSHGENISHAILLERAWLALADGDPATAQSALDVWRTSTAADGGVLLPLDPVFGGWKQPEATQIVLAQLALDVGADAPLLQLERAWSRVALMVAAGAIAQDAYPLLVWYAPQIVAAFARHAADDPVLFRAARLSIADVAVDAAGVLYGEAHPVTTALSLYAESAQLTYPDGPGDLDGDDIADIVTDLHTTHGDVVASVAWFAAEYDVPRDQDRVLLAWFDAAGLFEDVDGRAFDERWAVPRTLRQALPGVWMQRLAAMRPPAYE